MIAEPAQTLNLRMRIDGLERDFDGFLMNSQLQLGEHLRNSPLMDSIKLLMDF